MMQYTQDYDERYPLLFEGVDVIDGQSSHNPGIGTLVVAPVGSPGNIQTSFIDSYGLYSTWRDFIQPYVKSSQLFSCPSTTSELRADEQYYYNPGVSGFFRTNVGYCGIPLPAIPITNAQFDHSAETFLVIEASPYGCGSNGIYCAFPYGIEQYAALIPANRPHVFRHFDGMNTLHADNHVKWYSANRFRDSDLAEYIVSTVNNNNKYFCP